MTAKPTHKFILALLLLTVYVFIVTPVPYWHQHQYAANTTGTQSEENSFSVSDTTTADSNCSICSHHYTAYTNDATKPIVIVSITAVAGKHLTAVSVIFTSFDAFKERGPPSFHFLG